jgi:catechol 2,3-dioxygenase-like lactoylglutathione lyase family enzyme
MLFLSGRFREDSMIHHLSIAARDPKRAAEALAEIMGGKAVPFPPNPGSFFALQLDDHGSGVEVYPAGTELQPAGEEGGAFVKKPRDGRGFGATHFALSVGTDAETVNRIASKAGWHCVTCNRGPFHVIEVWVENDTMVEVLPPEFAAEYLAFTSKDKVLAAMANAPNAAARHAGRHSSAA